MTAQFKSKVFKAGNSVAVRLPRDVAYAIGTEITIERQGDTVTIKPAFDREAALAMNRAVVEDIRAIWADFPDRKVEERQQPIAPYRSGLI